MPILVSLTLLLSVQAASLVDASKLTVSAASTAELDTRKLKGELFRLAWSPDAQQVYLRTIERDKTGNVKTSHHYLLSLDGKSTGVEEEPAWAAAYWTWKSTQAAPGRPAFKIDVEQQRRRVNTTSVPMGGDLARGGTEGGATGSGSGVGLGAGDAMAAALQSQMVNVYTLKLKGEIVGEFVNAAAVPGLTFGWGPVGTGVIAFANPEGRIVLMDEQGHKQEIASSRSALLPAWSDDGRMLAFLETSGKNKVTLRCMNVTPTQ